MKKKQSPMSRVLGDLPERRFKEINDRLEKISAKDIRKFLYGSGYFPEKQYIPDDFFSTRDLAKPENIKNLEKVSEKDLNPYEIPSFVFFPKSKFAIKTLAVPPLVNYIALSNLIADHWDDIKKHLILESTDLIIPYTYPLFYEDQNRSHIGIDNHLHLSEVDLPRASVAYTHCLLLDIKNFYPSIYTHSIAWALDPETVQAGGCICTYKTKCTPHSKDYFPNKFDRLVRSLDRRRTKGIPIGPFTSDVISEILLRRIDKKTSEYALEKDIPFIGFRYKDDYFLFTNSYEHADKIRKQMQKYLNDFHLEVNENKTKIISSDELEDKKTWKVEVEELKNEIRQTYLNKNSKGQSLISESNLRDWIRKTDILYKDFSDSAILKSVLGALVQPPGNAVCITQRIRDIRPYSAKLDGTYMAVLVTLSQLCKKEPSTWSQFSAFICLCYEGAETNVKTAIKNLLNDYVSFFLEKEDSYLLLWTLWAMWRCKVKVTATTLKKIEKLYSDNWLILSIAGLPQPEEVINNREYSRIKNTKLDVPVKEVISVFSSGRRY